MRNTQLAAAQATPPTLEMAEKLVLETVRHVERLGELSVKFPEQFKPVARRMPAWPMMRFERDSSDEGLWHAQYRLELGKDYPLDISSGARSHPSSLTGQYLTLLVERVHRVKSRAGVLRPGTKPASGTGPAGMTADWITRGGKKLRGELETLLEIVVKMPPLTKGTSDEWSRQVFVPLIMLTDAGSNEAGCKVPALLAIWRQRGVKSPATFKSRLLTKVRQTLRSLARAA